ncbi:MAG: UvrD-helicase domain-containing protein, partial [Myxococcota bacterium]
MSEAPQNDIHLVSRPVKLAEIDHDRHSVIEASAGTGKTYTIEHLVVDLLLANPDLRIDQILVVTFTERATSELTARIRKLLQRIVERDPQMTAEADDPHWVVDKDGRRRLQRALFNFDTAPIHTIHGFCHRVLTENAFQNRRLFEQEHVDFDTLFERVFREALRTTLSCDAEYRPYLQAWLHAKGGGIAELQKLLATCVRSRAELRPDFDEEAILAAADALTAHADGFKDALKAELKAEDVHHSSAGAWARYGAELMEAAREAVDRQSPFPLLEAASEAKAFEKAQEYLDKFGDVGPLSTRLNALVEHTVPIEAAVVRRFLTPVQTMLAEEKDREGLFGYDDMLQMVWDSLDSDRGSDLLDVLRSRFKYGLIDEFQDTDDLQWKIFKRIFHESDGENIFYLIGDPKQAIYSFRGADVHTYLTARDTVDETGGETVRLTKNYRSSERLIDALNHIFRSDAEPSFFSGEIGYDAKHLVECGFTERAAFEPSGEEAVPVHICEVVDEELDNRRFKTGMRLHYAREIDRLLSAGGLQVLEEDEDEPRPLEPQDIFILTRSGREGLEVAEFLRQRDIPFAFFKQDGLFQTREARDVYELLRATSRPFDRSRRLKAWRTPFFDIGLDELADADELAETHPLFEDLLGWHELAEQGYFETLFADVIERSGLIRRKILFERGERELTNYLHIFELLLQEAAHGGLDIEALTVRLKSFIDDTVTPEGEDGNVQRLESEQAAVQIMTMHKSKGLEAEVVFVWGGFGKSPSRATARFHDGGERVLHVGNLDAREKAIFDREEAEEAQRLLYVALTRAKSRVYLPYLSRDEKGKRARKVNGSYAALMPRLDAIVDALPEHHAWFRHREWAFEWPEDRTPSADQLDALGKWSPPEDVPEAYDDAAFRRYRENQPQITSYSRLKKRTNMGRRDLDIAEFKADEDVSIEDILPTDAMPGGKAAGVFLHALLEDLDFGWVHEHDSLEVWQDSDEVAAYVLERMRRFGIDTRWVDYCRELMWNATMSPLSLRDGRLDGIARVERDAREMEFIYPIPEEGHPTLDAEAWKDFRIERGYIKGFIDLLLEHDGLTYFADWKSDILADYGPGALERHVSERYGIQSKLYTIATTKL